MDCEGIAWIQKDQDIFQWWVPVEYDNEISGFKNDREFIYQVSAC
jgi:hypothetical protein